MGVGKSQLTDEDITATFKEVDADNNGVLDPLELMAAANKLISRDVSSKEIESMVDKYGVHGTDGLLPDEFVTLVKELDVASPEALPSHLYEVKFPDETLGFSVKNGEGPMEGKVVVSKIKSEELSAKGEISPDDEIYAVNGVPVAKQGVTSHGELASKVIKIASRPITITFVKPE
jgi:C-terminal processing protease CtpA/Prc